MGGKERGDARIEWASIEPRILPSTHTADERRAGSPKCFSGGGSKYSAPTAVKLHGKTLTNYWPSGH